MKVWKRAFVRLAVIAVVCSGWPEGQFMAYAQQSTTAHPTGVDVASSNAGSGSDNREAKLEELPDSPGATLIRSQEQAASMPQSSAPANSSTQSSSLPQAGAQSADPSQATQAPAQTTQTPSTEPPAAQPAAPQQATPAQNQTDRGSTQRPVGTAAAESNAVSGVAASQPSGVAIAPAKQRRARSLVLKVGALIGAGVAVGTVVALSAGTSSKPPGAH